MSTQHHMQHHTDEQQESTLTTLSWVGGMLVVARRPGILLFRHVNA